MSDQELYAMRDLIASHIACEKECQDMPTGCGCALTAARAVLSRAQGALGVPSKEDISASVSRELHMDQILTLSRELGAVTEKLIASEQAYRQLERKAAKERRRLQSAAHTSTERSPPTASSPADSALSRRLPE